MDRGTVKVFAKPEWAVFRSGRRRNVPHRRRQSSPGGQSAWRPVPRNPDIRYVDATALIRCQGLPALYPSTFLFAAVGIEKSWGGEQIATNGRFIVAGLPVEIPQANMAIGRDDFLRGHFQFQVPLAQDFTIAGGRVHDFEATGGFRRISASKFGWPNSSCPASPAK